MFGVMNAQHATSWLLKVACEYGMVHVVPETGGPRGKDYCILYNPQWAHLPHDLSKAVQDWTASVLCSPSSLPAKGFTNQLPMVARGNCTFYEKVRLAQGSGARGLLIVSKEALLEIQGEGRVPDNSLPYFHKRPQVLTLLLALLCVAVSVVWGVFRNEDQWAWILQDALGIAFCLYTLKTIRLPTFKLPMVLKVPRLNTSPLALCDRPFSLLGFGDILVPGLLVAYCHRFDIQVQSSRVYFVACTIAYGIGLLVTFMALALMQRGQPALLYLVPCTLVTSCALALWRRELGVFWTGSGFVVNTSLL
ncbi:signal peptide peptidase-like 2B [Camelus ferus]|nr:signal peptide peptidase-like 2B [Camelus ferus]